MSMIQITYLVCSFPSIIISFVFGITVLFNFVTCSSCFIWLAFLCMLYLFCQCRISLNNNYIDATKRTYLALFLVFQMIIRPPSETYKTYKNLHFKMGTFIPLPPPPRKSYINL